MIFKVAICDDEPHSMQTLKKCLEQAEIDFDIDFDISYFNNSSSLLAYYTTYGAFQILFLDVELPDQSGIETAKKIRKIPDRDVKIVFVSNYPQYMKESFDVRAFQYITKPYSYTEFKKVITQLTEDFKASINFCLLLRTDLGEQPVNLKEIISIETINAKKKLLKINLETETITAFGLISDFENNYNNAGFISPYRGILVNIQKIHIIQQDKVLMSNGKIFPLSRRKEKLIKQVFNKKLLTMKTNQ